MDRSSPAATITYVMPVAMTRKIDVSTTRLRTLP